MFLYVRYFWIFFVVFTMQGFSQSMDISKAKAYWISPTTLVWNLEKLAPEQLEFWLCHDPQGKLDIQKKTALSIPLQFQGPFFSSKYPYLNNYSQFRIQELPPELIQKFLQQQLVIVAKTPTEIVAASALQTFGVLDALFNCDEDLGPIFTDAQITMKLWAPTAKSVTLHLYNKPEDNSAVASHKMTSTRSGVWEIHGDYSWKNKFYLYEIEVFVRSSGKIERNLVTDPYSTSLSCNSEKSHIVDLQDNRWMPQNWRQHSIPSLEKFTDISLYELHIRDFSIYDSTVPEPHRGRYLAFTHSLSNGVRHLKGLAEAGLSHVHLLPVFDIATIQEDPRYRTEPIIPEAPGDSDLQQKAVTECKDSDGFNWGYDPYHYNVPEGSYATDANGAQRIYEFRQMIQALHNLGLRVVMDVVFNHTHAAGQNNHSVLDKIVPDYYYRLDAEGNVQNTSCCADTASERLMMEKLMIDSLLSWVRHYKVDGFRFDLMGHHTTDNLRKIREKLDQLNLRDDGIDGKKIYVYGEGWKFGSLDNILSDRACHQKNMYGSNIGTFNDRIRDSLRGGNYEHRTKSDQGFTTGLYYDYNHCSENVETPKELQQQKQLLNDYADIIRIAMAGNLRDYEITTHTGEKRTGEEIDYRGNPAGYTAQPHESINYVSAHDNYTLWDQISAKAPFQVISRIPPTADINDKARMQNLALSIVALGQGIPFFHAGSEMLRSKSGDGDSYNSGDWFNRLDFSYRSNNWGSGLPPAEKNFHEWNFWKPRLQDTENFAAQQKVIISSIAQFHRMLKIRRSSPLLSLATAKQIQQKVRFLNAEKGKQQIPGVIAMLISDTQSKKIIDQQFQMMLCCFNVSSQPVEFEHPDLKNLDLQLHPILQKEIRLYAEGQEHHVSPDVTTNSYQFDKNVGKIVIPERSTLVFVLPR